MISKFDKTDAKISVNKTFKPLTGFLNSIEAEFTMSLNISHRIYPCSDMCIEDEAAVCCKEYFFHYNWLHYLLDFR
jgi:hypothetical protein